MSRTRCRISQDEVARMVKAVRSCGLSVAKIRFDGEHVDVIIGEIGEDAKAEVEQNGSGKRLIREPQL